MAKNCVLRKAASDISTLSWDLLEIRSTIVKESGYSIISDKLFDIVCDLNSIYRLLEK